jgi:uncharacterized protein
LAALIAPAQEELPADRLLRTLQPTADVNDFAGILTADQRQSLEQRCKALREKTGAQLAVVTLKSLEGGQVDDFAVKLFQRWGIGDKEKKNGILLLVAIQDRKWRIEVGYGLEPILPDALAGRIAQEQLLPAFRQQRYADGLTAAVNRIIEIVERNEPAPKNMQPNRRGANDLVIALVMLVLFLAVGSFMAGFGIGSRTGVLIALGLLFVVIPFIIGLMLVFPAAPICQVPLGFVAGFLGWRAGKGDRGFKGRPGPWVWTTPGFNTWDWGSTGGNTWSGSDWSGGSSFSGGSSSWGGFGGGSSGGGGASGGW